jgi:hypothetical protein
MRCGDIEEARQAQIIIPAVIVIVNIVVTLAASLWSIEDNPVRGNDVEFRVKHFD